MKCYNAGCIENENLECHFYDYNLIQKCEKRALKMNKEQHRIHHRELHKRLDSIISDYLLSCEEASILKNTIDDLIHWSANQIIKVDHEFRR